MALYLTLPDSLQDLATYILMEKYNKLGLDGPKPLDKIWKAKLLAKYIWLDEIWNRVKSDLGVTDGKLNKFVLPLNEMDCMNIFIIIFEIPED